MRYSPNASLVGVPGGAKRITTPALMVDAAKLKSNIAQMMERCRDAGLALRPHGKTHKCTRLAQMQIDAGALGICAATGREGIAFARAGLTGILITAPVVQYAQIDELARLHAEGADMRVVIDHPEVARRWEKALAGSTRPLPALVDVDIGMNRTGALTPEAAVEIAARIKASPLLDYAGVQAYSGRVQHINDFAERRAAYGAQIERLKAVLKELRSRDLAPAIVSGGGTGTFAIDTVSGVFTESQAGSYVFMDVEYEAVQLFPAMKNPWQHSLFLRASVVSANVPGQVTVNAGFKSFATDGPAPAVYGDSAPGMRYEFYGDEYGRLLLDAGVPPPALGSTADLFTSHCDPTINLHDWLHVVEGDTLVDIWQIDARGVLG